MRDYVELEKELRYCGDRNNLDCKGCSRKPSPICDDGLKLDAADAIKELLAKDKNVPDKNVGEWIAVQSNGERFFRCSRCGAFLKESFFNLGYSVNYCPNCGAAMMEVINDA